MKIEEGWIKHDGGPCPVPHDTWVQIIGQTGEPSGAVGAADFWNWSRVTAYRVFAPVAVAPDQPAADPLDAAPGPSAFVRDAAVRILAGMAARDYRVTNMPHEWVGQAVQTAIVLEKALQEAGK